MWNMNFVLTPGDNFMVENLNKQHLPPELGLVLAFDIVRSGNKDNQSKLIGQIVEINTE